MRCRDLTFALIVLVGCQREQETLSGPVGRLAPVTPQTQNREPVQPPTLAQVAPRVSSSTTANALPQLADLAEKLVPSVVSIQVETGGGERRLPRGIDPFEFFGGGGGRGQLDEPHGHGLGSGFLIDATAGLVLTNNHVVENAASIEVTFSLADGTEHVSKGTVVGTAPEYDVALVKVTDAAIRN